MNSFMTAFLLARSPLLGKQLHEQRNLEEPVGSRKGRIRDYGVRSKGKDTKTQSRSGVVKPGSRCYVLGSRSYVAKISHSPHGISKAVFTG